MKRLIQSLFVVGSILAVVDIFTASQLRAFGLPRFCAEAILVALAVIFGWRQIFAGWRESRRWFCEHAKIDLRILWRRYNALKDKIVAFEGSAAERKWWRQARPAYGPDGNTVRLAGHDEIKLVTAAHADLDTSNDDIVRSVIRRRLAEQGVPLPTPEPLRRELEEHSQAQAIALAREQDEREALQALDPAAAALKEERELLLTQTNNRLRELRVLENVRARGQEVEESAEGEPVDRQAQIASEQKEMEFLTELKTQLEEALQARPTSAD